MKKNVFFTMLATLMVLALTSCSLNEDLLKKMVGTYTDNDPDEKVTVQFYPSTDGETGRFIECRESLKNGEDSDGIEVNIHMTAFVTGTYKLTADQRLSYVYDLDMVEVFYATWLLMFSATSSTTMLTTMSGAIRATRLLRFRSNWRQT